MTTAEITRHLLAKFPEAKQNDVRLFLTLPNPYIDGRLPWRLRDMERIESLFDRWLHPLDVF